MKLSGNIQKQETQPILKQKQHKGTQILKRRMGLFAKE